MPSSLLRPRSFATALAFAFVGGTVASDEAGERAFDIRDRGWPESWFQAPKTASELGIARFNESPILAGRDLPPVAERLPDDPVVVEPYERIGRYGGTARITMTDHWQYFNWEAALTISADMRDFLPNLAESWDVSDDGKMLTIRLRPGIRWSDGEPLTSDDFVFSFNHLWMDDDWSPVKSERVQGGRIEKIDEFAFRYVFERPNPLFVNMIAQYGSHFVDPEHYFRNFHPAFVGRDRLNAQVKEDGYITWMARFGALRDWSVEESADVPTLRAYRVVQRTLQMMRLERNPYYFKVDPEGNQLPYIDAIDAEVVSEPEIITAQASTGQLDFAAFALRTQDIPLLKLGERGGLINVHIWTRLHVSDVVIQLNFTHDDARLRALYWDKRFRQALSHAINREEMNQIIYFGRGVPSQVTAHPSSSYYEQAFADAYIEYDAPKARALLDEMGLADVDDDGFREYPDGSPLTITLEYLDFETPKAITMELVREYWREVGIDLRLKLIDGGLQNSRAIAGKMQMTLWHADRVTDILFPTSPEWWAPRALGWEYCMWNEWVRHYKTRHKPRAQWEGEVPPPPIADLMGWADELRTTTDPAKRIAAGKNLLRSNAENLWNIGTVGLAPQPVVVSKRLRNVVPNGIWGWDNRWTLSYHPATWYIDEAGH